MRLNYLVREFVRVHVVLYVWLYALEIMMSTASNLRRIEKEKCVVFQNKFYSQRKSFRRSKNGDKGALCVFCNFHFWMMITLFTKKRVLEKPNCKYLGKDMGYGNVLCVDGKPIAWRIRPLVVVSQFRDVAVNAGHNRNFIFQNLTVCIRSAPASISFIFCMTVEPYSSHSNSK